jgi:sulfotransferase family protein
LQGVISLHEIKNVRNAIIVGMPRSGTSLTAAIFVKKNYRVVIGARSDLLPRNEANPFGYWEAESMNNRNAAILGAAGFPFHNTWMFDRIQPEHTKRIYELSPLPEHMTYLQAFERHGPWVWKDPRFCYTLAYWWPMMNPKTTGVLLVRRASSAILRSFNRLDWRRPLAQGSDDFYARIDDHLEAAMAAIRTFDIPYLEIDYEEFVDAPERVARRLSNFFGISLTAAELNVQQELNHNSWRGRLSGALRTVTRVLPVRTRRAIARIVPQTVMEAIYPEKKLTRNAKDLGPALVARSSGVTG